VVLQAGLAQVLRSVLGRVVAAGILEDREVEGRAADREELAHVGVVRDEPERLVQRRVACSVRCGGGECPHQPLVAR
jgi:hypothetical protein